MVFCCKVLQNVQISDPDRVFRQCKMLKTDKIRVVREDAFHFINNYKLNSDFRPFDFIFADPPYSLALLSSVPKVIFDPPTILDEKGVFVLEHSKNNNFSPHPCFMFERTYGNVHFSFFKNGNTQHSK